MHSWPCRSRRACECWRVKAKRSYARSISHRVRSSPCSIDCVYSPKVVSPISVIRSQPSHSSKGLLSEANQLQNFFIWTLISISSQGFPLPPNFNPADFFIKKLAVIPSDRENCLKSIDVRHYLFYNKNQLFFFHYLI